MANVDVVGLSVYFLREDIGGEGLHDKHHANVGSSMCVRTSTLKMPFCGILKCNPKG